MLSTVLSTEKRGRAVRFGPLLRVRTRFCEGFVDFLGSLSLITDEAYLFLRE